MIRICDREIRVEGQLLRIARLEADGYEFLEDPGPVLEGLRKSKTRIDLFTFTQKLPETSPKYHYPMEWDNFAALPVSTFEHWWDQQIGFKARNKAKQAEKKGVRLKEVPFSDELANGIHAIYNECPVRQGRLFRHYGKNIETVRKEEATFLDTSAFIGAFVEDELIGFVKLTWDETRTQAGLMNIISLIQHRDKAPNNALIAHSVGYCADHGIKYLVYSNFAYGNKSHDSIVDFKERNAFQRIDVPRYYVPLTRLGSVAFRFGLHHKLTERIPEPLLLKLRELRRAWHHHKLQSAAQVS